MKQQKQKAKAKAERPVARVGGMAHVNTPQVSNVGYWLITTGRICLYSALFYLMTHQAHTHKNALLLSLGQVAYDKKSHTRGLVTVDVDGDGDNAPPAKRPAATSETTDTPRLWPLHHKTIWPFG